MSEHWTRREALARVGAFSFAAALAPRWSFAADPRPAPPVARIEPASDAYFGETIVDPYRWMENPADRDWEPFMKGHAAHARAVLDSLPGRKALHERVAQLSGDTAITRSVQSAGGRVFYEKRARGADNFQLYVRDGLAGAERVLLDPTTLKDDGRHVSMDWWAASPDGRHVAVGLSPAGSELANTHVIEVATGRWLPEKLERTPVFPASWLPDGSGFLSMRLRPDAKVGAVDFLQDAAVWLHRLGTDPKQDVRVFARGMYPSIPMQPEEFPIVFADPSSAYVVAGAIGGVRLENPWWSARLDEFVAGRPQWRRICEIADEVRSFAVRGDEVYLLTTKGAENGRVLRTSLSAPDIARAQVVVAESGAVVERISAARDALYVEHLDAGYSALRRVASDGRGAHVPLPFEGSIASLYTLSTEDGAWINATSWLEPFTVLRFDPATNRCTDAGLSPRPSIDAARYETIRTFATARDGTKVPLSIVARKGLKRDGGNPALVEAYGAYQISSTPVFNVRGFAFLERGGVLATAHVRGGGEYGRRWWKAGHRLNKPNTWRDLIDCCETLVKDGWTSPARLAIKGGSAGGIAVGRALTDRPDLFAAVISNVGASNMLRAEFTQNGPTNVDEFGTVKDRDGFAGLKAMDAYHAVRDGTKYPAVLLTTGMTDLRVAPWMAAKMAARLAKATASANPVLLRVTFDAGHGIGSTRSQVDDERADEFAFVLWRAGAPDFQPQSG